MNIYAYTVKVSTPKYQRVNLSLDRAVVSCPLCSVLSQDLAQWLTHGRHLKQYLSK